MERQRLKLAMKSLQWGGEEIVPNSKMTTHVWRCYGSKELHFLKIYKSICLVIWHYFAGISVPHLDPGTHWMRNILKSLKEILSKKIQLKRCWGQVGVRWVTVGKGGPETGRRPRSRHQEPSYPPNFIYPPHILGSFGAWGVLSIWIYLSNSF